MEQYFHFDHTRRNCLTAYQNLVIKSPRYTKSRNFKEKQITCFSMKKKCCHVRMLFPNKYCSKDNLDPVIDMQQYNPLIHQQLRESKIQAVIHIVNEQNFDQWCRW